jgi:hypothetical protein
MNVEMPVSQLGIRYETLSAGDPTHDSRTRRPSARRALRESLGSVHGEA